MELAQNTFEAMKDRKAVILANHGLVTGDKDLAGAFNIAEEIEHCARVYILARSIEKPILLETNEMTRTMDRLSHSYGQK